MSAAASGRLTWAAQVVAPRPGERLIEVGRVRLRTGPLLDVPLDGRFDAVVAVDVRALWTPPAAEGIADAVGRLAADRGLPPYRRHRAAIGRSPSVAVELRRPAPPG